MNESTARKNRQTQTTIEVRNDDFLGWITLCIDHGYHAEHKNKTQALSWAASPRTWCEGCQA